MSRYSDRRAAGRILAGYLQAYARQAETMVLALPRGGVPVAFEVAQALQLALDVFIVRKLGVPGFEELAMGAIATGGVRVRNQIVLQRTQITEDIFNAVAEREGVELQRREQLYRAQRPPPDLRARTAILVDDGLATGSTMRAAVEAVRQQGARRVVVAAPVASPATCITLAAEADEVVCPLTPSDFNAVGQWYLDFTQTTDDEVRQLLITASH